MKIIIAACGYGAGNIGDEAILTGLKNLILNIDSTIEISVMSINPKVTQKMHNIQSFSWMNYKNPKSIIKYIKNIKDSDLVLFGGATLGDDTYGISYPILSTSMMIFFAKLLGKKTGMISIGVNKFETKLGQALVKYFYGNTNFLTTRDSPSLNILKSIGVNEHKVFETADAAYALVPLNKDDGISALELRGIDVRKKLVAISVLDEVYQNFDFKEKIANVCDYLIEKYDYMPVFINHEVRVGMDQEATNDAIGFMQHKDKVRILSTEFYSPELMASMLKQFEFTIGMRMHILILSTIAHIPVIGISRVDKVDNFFEQLNSDAFTHIKNFSYEKLLSSVDKIIKNRNIYVEKSIDFSKNKKVDFERTRDIIGKYIK